MFESLSVNTVFLPLRNALSMWCAMNLPSVPPILVIFGKSLPPYPPVAYHLAGDNQQFVTFFLCFQGQLQCSCSDCENTCTAGMVIPWPKEDFLIGDADGIAVIVTIIFGVGTLAGLISYFFISKKCKLSGLFLRPRIRQLT